MRAGAMRIWRLVLAWVLSCAAALASSLSTGTIATGTRWETRYYVQDSGQPGQTVIVVAGIHGNEPAGPRAADAIRAWPTIRGKLIVVPQANKVSLGLGKRLLPTESDRDLNRAFPRGANDPPRGELATALWEFVTERKPDWLVDLHESVNFRDVDKSKVGNSIIYYPNPTTRAMAERLAAALAPVAAGHDFRLLRPGANGSLVRAAAQRLGAHAFIIETTRTDQPLSLRARQHRLAVHTLLKALKMVSVRPHTLFPLQRKPGEVRVALYDAEGATSKTPLVEAKLMAIAGVVVRRVGPPEVAQALGQFDLVVMPGGSASRQARALGLEGRKAIRRFVANGGAYLGFCAGAYLATYGYSWSLGILDMEVFDRAHWKRGKGTVAAELTDPGRRFFPGASPRFDIYYANGPLLRPARRPEIPDPTILAVFRGEVAQNGAPRGLMPGTPAVVCGVWGRGRVMVFSPHPELRPGLEHLVARAVTWLADRKATTAGLDYQRN